MNKKLSIIIPCYNCESTIIAAVDSCFKQGFEANEFELILVDDCSTDNTKVVLEQLNEKYSNITVAHNETNLGGGATRNKAVSIASSEIIYCLDSDDLLPVGTLKKLYTCLKERNLDGVTTHYTINFRGNDLTDVSHIVTMAYVGQPIPFEALLEKHNKMCGLYQVFMFTKSAFTKAGGYPTHHGFDTQGFAWRFLSSGLIAHTCPETFYLQRIENGQSYYLREFNKGKVNFNWRDIFFEHKHLFNLEAQTLIDEFDYQDFTKSLYDEVRRVEKPFVQNIKFSLKKEPDSSRINIRSIKAIKRNSFRGILLRIKSKF